MLPITVFVKEEFNGHKRIYSTDVSFNGAVRLLLTFYRENNRTWQELETRISVAIAAALGVSEEQIELSRTTE